jgi:basic amino acid/polyamine antiporter, APA family
VGSATRTTIPALAPRRTDHPDSTSGPGLLRGISRPLLVAVLVNSIVGAGILGLPGRAYAIAGTWSLLAWGLCGIITAAVALCFAEVGSRFTQTGGPYLYARVAFGPVMGFAVGWVTWVTRPLTIAVIGNLLVGYASALWPAAGSGAPRLLVITGFMAVLTGVLVAGIRQTAFVSTAFTVGKVVVLGVFVVAGLPAVEWDRIAFDAAPDAGALASAVLLLVFAFGGFETGAVVAGEIGNPRRDLPAGMMAALGIVATLYVLIQLVAIGTAPGLATSDRPLADAAAVVLGPIVGRTFALVALMLLLGTMLMTLLLGTRMMYALGEQGQLPAFFARVHPRTRTPVGSILVTCGIAYLATLFSTFAGALVIATSTRVVTYLVTCLALPALRRRSDVPAALFQLRAGVPIAVACTLVLVFLLFQSSWVELATLVAVSAAGLVPWWLARPGAPRH